MVVECRRRLRRWRCTAECQRFLVPLTLIDGLRGTIDGGRRRFAGLPRLPQVSQMVVVVVAVVAIVVRIVTTMVSQRLQLVDRWLMVDVRMEMLMSVVVRRRRRQRSRHVAAADNGGAAFQMPQMLVDQVVVDGEELHVQCRCRWVGWLVITRRRSFDRRGFRNAH